MEAAASTVNMVGQSLAPFALYLKNSHGNALKTAVLIMLNGEPGKWTKLVVNSRNRWTAKCAQLFTLKRTTVAVSGEAL
jgi:hypothetical protein